MLKTQLLHPEILDVLARSGHGSGILIADGNYPFVSLANPAAARVYLNLAPGLVTVTQVLEVLLSAIVVEAAHIMVPGDGAMPDIQDEFRQMLPGIEMQTYGRFDFYDKAQEPSVSLVIATGEQRLFANILLTLGVVT